MLEIIRNCSIRGDKIVVCAPEEGLIVCVAEDESINENFKLLQNQLITTLYDENRVYVAALETSIPLSEISLKFHDKKPTKPCFTNPETPVLFAKELDIRRYGALKKIEYLTLNERVLITQHTNYVVFHSLSIFCSPYAVIESDKPILDYQFGWDSTDVNSSFNDRSLCPEMLKCVMVDFFAVTLLVETSVMGRQDREELARLDFFLPPVEEVILPAPIADALCLLYDVNKSDENGALRNLFTRHEVVSRISETVVYVKSRYNGSVRANQHISLSGRVASNFSLGGSNTSLGGAPSGQSSRSLINLTSQFKIVTNLRNSVLQNGQAEVRLVPVEEKAIEGNSVNPSQFDIPLRYKTLAEQARLNVAKLAASGTLSSAFDRAHGKHDSIDFQTLEFCRTLKKVIESVLRPLEKYTAELVLDTKYSVGEELPAHTCFLRERQKTLLEEINTFLHSNKKTNQEIVARISKIKENQEVLKDKLASVMKSYYEVLDAESMSALIRVLKDYISVYEPNSFVLPNMPGLLRVLQTPRLSDLTENIKSVDAIVEELIEHPNSRELNLYSSIHEAVKRIDDMIRIK